MTTENDNSGGDTRHSSPTSGAEWIPCETLLPPECKKVLTYSEAYGMVVGSMDDRHKWGAEHCDHETGEPWLSDEGIVTHWMPLPNPPNGNDCA